LSYVGVVFGRAGRPDDAVYRQPGSPSRAIRRSGPFSVLCSKHAPPLMRIP